MNVENNHVLIEKPILDSYEDEHQRKELVDLVNVIETRTRGGKYEVTDFESDSLQEISENFVERTESDKKKTISVDYLVKLFSGKLDFSQEQLDDGQYNLTDFLGKKIIKLKRRTRNRDWENSPNCESTDRYKSGRLEIYCFFNQSRAQCIYSY